MSIRICKDNEINKVKNIWKYCFSDSEEYTNFYFKKKFDYRNTVVLENNNEIISSIHLNQHKVYLNEKEFDVSYVVGVSTLPEARGIGAMKELMKQCFYEMYNKGQSISILMPIDFRLYTGFGFTNCYDVLEQRVDIFDLKKFKINGVFKKATKQNVSDLVNIYSESVKQYNGYAIRDKKYFSELVEEIDIDGGYIYINYIDDAPVGYIVYSIINSIFLVREVYYKNIIAYKSILKFIFNHNTQCKKVEMISAVNNPLRQILDNPKDSEFIIKPFMMARIIDFEKFINACDFNIKKNFINDNINIENMIKKINIMIEDNYIEKNNGIFTLTYKDGTLKSQRNDEISEYDIKMTISEATSIFTNYMKVEDLFVLREDYNVLKNREDYNKIINFFEFELNINHINEYV